MYTARVRRRRAKARSDAIDMQLEEDAKRLKRECNILLLGSSNSGKSTVIKQLRIAYQGGFSDSERATYAPVVCQNVLQSAQTIIAIMGKLDIDCQISSNKALADRIANYELNENTAHVFSSEIAEAIHCFWKDPAVPKVADEHGSEFYLMDNAFYFFSEVLRIGSPNYVPNDMDILLARQKSASMFETRFLMGQLSLRVFDIGSQRSERRKWIHCFESVTSIIFCTALSDYDQVLFGEKSQNRLTESLVLFEAVINSRWFLRTSIILFLNKIDLFKRKLPKVPLERYFSEYTGGNDTNKAAKYILWKFMQANRARLSVYPHLTQVTDLTGIRLVAAAVKETILQNALKAKGIL
ncbi:heterotrimeric G-protein alpha subunit, GPA3-like protein [Marasmius fiardii PR-910]|nr:heterotrimeric G-protein alpha subunit, GPA3-like protein [Marasmius fiardii PR-910]